MKIDFLIGDNRYGSTTHFAKSFSKALQRAGVQTRLHWIGDGHFFHAFHEIRRDPSDLTCSFSDIHLAGTPLGELWQIPHLSILVDPAIYFLHQLKGKNSWVSCVDQGDVAFLSTLNKDRVFYLPHGGDRTLLTPPQADRPYDVVFFGSCSEPPQVDATIFAAAKRVLSSENVTILQALLDLGIKQERLPGLHMEVDLYTRFHDRINLLRSLKSHDVHIWGNGPWKRYVPHAVVHSPIPFDQTLAIMKQAKVVVNSSPRFKHGLHERIICGSLCGAAILSAHGGCFRYTYGEWEDQSFENWETKAAELQSQILMESTWDHCATILLKNFG